MKEQTSTVVIAIDGEDELRLLQTIANDTGAAVTTVPVRDGGVSVVLVAGALIAVVKTLERCIAGRAEARRDRLVDAHAPLADRRTRRIGSARKKDVA